LPPLRPRAGRLLPGAGSDEETDDPHYTDRRNFYKVKSGARGGLPVESLLYAGNNLNKARLVFERTTEHRPACA
jgi:hypothetical protein